MWAQIDLESLKIGGNSISIAVKFSPKYHLISKCHSTIMATKIATLSAMVSA